MWFVYKVDSPSKKVRESRSYVSYIRMSGDRCEMAGWSYNRAEALPLDARQVRAVKKLDRRAHVEFTAAHHA